MEWEAFYKQWCKNTKRSGGILVGSSIRELLQAYTEFLHSKQPHHDNDRPPAGAAKEGTREGNHSPGPQGTGGYAVSCLH